MKEEGIEFKTGINVGKDITAKELYEANDAVLLTTGKSKTIFEVFQFSFRSAIKFYSFTTGATWPRDLPIPGRDSAGIHFAMEFLQTWQQKQHGDVIDTESKLSAKGRV